MDHWTKELLKNLDDTSKQKIQEKFRPKNPFSQMSNGKLLELRDQSKNEQDFLEKQGESRHLKKENNQYFVIFDQCYGPLVNKDIQNSSKTMYYCTLGSLKNKFGFGRTVDVKMQKTVFKAILNVDTKMKSNIRRNFQYGENR